MIRSFRCRETERIYQRQTSRRFPADMQRAAYRKLLLLMAATGLDDLRAPPGKRLEALKGDRAGQHSIRINDRWRVCFAWREDGAHDVEIVDHHRG